MAVQCFVINRVNQEETPVSFYEIPRVGEHIFIDGYNFTVQNIVHEVQKGDIKINLICTRHKIGWNQF